MFTIIAAPFKFLHWSFTNGWKGIIVLMVVIVALIIGFFVIRHSINDSMGPPKPAVNVNQVTAGLPSTKEAPVEISTKSREYYARQVRKEKDGTITMVDYWQVVNKKWIFTKGSFNLDETFGKVTVRKR